MIPRINVLFQLSEPPSAPRDVDISDFDHQSATIKWSPPVDDGGRPITHYIIQKKCKFGGWFDALVTDDKTCSAKIDDLEARVPGLSLGKWYQFRVLAVNKAGESPPSLETKPHLCRYKNCELPSHTVIQLHFDINEIVPQ